MTDKKEIKDSDIMNVAGGTKHEFPRFNRYDKIRRRMGSCTLYLIIKEVGEPIGDRGFIYYASEYSDIDFRNYMGETDFDDLVIDMGMYDITILERGFGEN